MVAWPRKIKPDHPIEFDELDARRRRDPIASRRSLPVQLDPFRV